MSKQAYGRIPHSGRCTCVLRKLSLEERRCEFVYFAERSNNTSTLPDATQQPKSQVKDDGIIPPGNHV